MALRDRGNGRSMSQDGSSGGTRSRGTHERFGVIRSGTGTLAGEKTTRRPGHIRPRAGRKTPLLAPKTQHRGKETARFGRFVGRGTGPRGTVFGPGSLFFPLRVGCFSTATVPDRASCLMIGGDRAWGSSPGAPGQGGAMHATREHLERGAWGLRTVPFEGGPWREPLMELFR
jgi:hypothetical protein